MADPTDDNQHLCANCIGNKTFAKWIRDNGSKGTCDFDKTHRRSRLVVTVDAFAEEVDRYFRDTYQHGAEYMYATEDSDNPSYATYGEPYKDILADDLECDEGVLDAVVDALPNADHYDIMQGGEAFYDEFSNYESIKNANNRERADEEDYWYERRFTYQWDEFCTTVQFERRFFKIKEILDELFGSLSEYNEGPIKPGLRRSAC